MTRFTTRQRSSLKAAKQTAQKLSAACPCWFCRRLKPRICTARLLKRPIEELRKTQSVRRTAFSLGGKAKIRGKRGGFEEYSFDRVYVQRQDHRWQDAERLSGRRFVDMDSYIEQRSGMPVSRIFLITGKNGSESGEEACRALRVSATL